MHRPNKRGGENKLHLWRLIDPGVHTGNFHPNFAPVQRSRRRPSRCKFNEFGILAAEKFPSAATTKVVAHTGCRWKLESFLVYTHQIKTCRVAFHFHTCACGN
jgi:hypothetical protein